MNRYPERQARQDESDLRQHGRKAGLRPGARLAIRGMSGDVRGAQKIGVALLTRVDGEWDAALVATREYGRRWFSTKPGQAFAVLGEI